MALVLESTAPFEFFKTLWGYQHMGIGASYLVAGDWMVSNLMLKGTYVKSARVVIDILGSCAIWMGRQFLRMDVKDKEQRLWFGAYHLLQSLGLRHWRSLQPLPIPFYFVHAITGALFLFCKPKAVAKPSIAK